MDNQAEITVEWAVSPPAATDPTIVDSGNNIVLNWTEVTETAYGMPFPLGTDVLYVIWYQPLDPYAPDSDYYYLLVNCGHNVYTRKRSLVPTIARGKHAQRNVLPCNSICRPFGQCSKCVHSP